MNAEEKAIRLHRALSLMRRTFIHADNGHEYDVLEEANRALHECAPLADWEKYIAKDDEPAE